MFRSPAFAGRQVVIHSASTFSPPEKSGKTTSLTSRARDYYTALVQKFLSKYNSIEI